jgi:hypothetical protein
VGRWRHPAQAEREAHALSERMGRSTPLCICLSSPSFAEEGFRDRKNPRLARHREGARACLPPAQRGAFVARCVLFRQQSKRGWLPCRGGIARTGPAEDM